MIKYVHQSHYSPFSIDTRKGGNNKKRNTTEENQNELVFRMKPIPNITIQFFSRVFFWLLRVAGVSFKV